MHLPVLTLKSLRADHNSGIIQNPVLSRFNDSPCNIDVVLCSKLMHPLGSCPGYGFRQDGIIFLNTITGIKKFGEHNQLCSLLYSIFDQRSGSIEICLFVIQDAIHLNGCHGEFIGHSHPTSYYLFSFALSVKRKLYANFERGLKIFILSIPIHWNMKILMHCIQTVCWDFVHIFFSVNRIVSFAEFRRNGSA